MHQREIVNQSVANIEMFYKDIGRIIKVIEEQMSNKKYKPLGNAATTWENSTSINNYESWLPVWFARIYSKEKTSNRAVGFCIHLGGERYLQNDSSAIEELDLKFPFMSVSVLEAAESVSKVNRSALYEALWQAVIFADNPTVTNKKIIKSEPLVYGGKYQVHTYLVDIFSLINGDVIGEMVVKPMDQLYKNNEKYLLDVDVSVIDVKSLEDKSDGKC